MTMIEHAEKKLLNTIKEDYKSKGLAEENKMLFWGLNVGIIWLLIIVGSQFEDHLGYWLLIIVGRIGDKTMVLVIDRMIYVGVFLSRN